MADFMEHVEALADSIGPRPVSTEEERQAAEYIADQLTGYGLEVDVDEFATPTGTRWVYVVAFCAMALGTVISGFGLFIDGLALPMYIIGLVLAVAAFAIYYCERNNRQILSQRRAGGISQNVVAKYVPSSVQRERNRRKIIICAHVDTVRAEPLAHPAIVGYYSLLRRIMFYVMIALVALLVVRMLPLPWPAVVDTVLWIISLVACVFVLVGAAAIGASRFMPFVAGGNDNASAAAVMLNVARLTADPAARERYAAETHVYSPEEIALEAEGAEAAEDAGAEFIVPLQAADAAEADAGVEADADAPVLHGEQAAREAGLVPEGAEIEYADMPDITTTLPVIGAAEDDELGDVDRLPLQGGAAERSEAEGVTQAAQARRSTSPDDPLSQAIPAPDSSPLQGEPKVPSSRTGLGAAEAVVRDPSQERPQVAPTPAAEASDELFEMEFLSKLGEEYGVVEDGASLRDASGAGSFDDAPRADGASAAQDDGPGVADETPSSRTGLGEAEAVVRDPSSARPQDAPTTAPEPVVYKKNPVVVDPNVPSWYAAARQKAAVAQGTQTATAGDGQPSYRSRYADVPMTIEHNTEEDVEASELPLTEEDAASLCDASGAGSFDDAPRGGAASAAQDDESGAAAESLSSRTGLGAAEAVVRDPSSARPQAAPTSEPASQPATESLFQLSDDELDDIMPDDGPIAANPASRPSSFAARIPSIGNSGEKSPRFVVEEAAEAEAEDADQDDGSRHLEQDSAQGEAVVRDPSSARLQAAPTSASEPPAPAPKRERHKPTARHITESFQPTRVLDEREEIVSPELRQAAPIQSSYEATPQAAGLSAQMPPVYADEAATRSPEPTQAQAVAASKTSSFPSLTGSFPSLTGSFPSLTGSFPSLTGKFTTVEPDSLPEPSFDAFAPNQAAMTGTIDIPESRFHNVVDKAGGFFSKFGRKKKNTADNEINWGDEDDDLGWKGGGYFTDDSGVMDAARRRAAEIRESVISMTEQDLLDKEVWFVALGAGNASGQGMKNFLDLHQSELRGSLIINLEAVGAGFVSYVESEGTGKPHRADRRLMSLVKRASRELTGHEMKSCKLDYRNTDATPAMLAGMRAISIMGIEGTAPVGWHWTTDTADIVSEHSLEFVTKLLLRVIENS